ncbi:flagellar assembly protein FliH [Stutzerimonas kirkiae]|uniref:flagellar assembly protein FliH n=1 Tax=Stutzerimonas kirkiae TaxID=2211392 RepID=UPI0010384925|nr:flagellar assembly protein FliH [Stutzerimonas kirkiae]TBV14640.1 flagellar assembly protein FliH [Stutzerimonas kirkiae]
MAKEHHPSDVIRAEDVSLFDRWALPSFDPHVDEPEPVAEPEAEQVPEENPDEAGHSEEVPAEEVKPLTLEELEAIRQEAYNEGFATGEKDGFHSGQLRARQEAEAALNKKLGSLELLMKQLFEPIAEQDQALEQGMVQLLGQMVREVVQRELRMDSSQLREVLSGALKLLPMGAQNVRIHVNPQDFETAKALRERYEEKWRILEDDALLPGGCRVETEQSRIDASIETRLDQVIKQLFEQQRESAAHAPEADLSIDLESPDAP